MVPETANFVDRYEYLKTITMPRSYACLHFIKELLLKRETQRTLGKRKWSLCKSQYRSSSPSHHRHNKLSSAKQTSTVKLNLVIPGQFQTVHLLADS